MSDSVIDEFLKNWTLLTSKLFVYNLIMMKKLLKFTANLIPIIIGYSFMSWIFLGLYDSQGFDKTLIILLVGVFWYGIRRSEKVMVSES